MEGRRPGDSGKGRRNGRGKARRDRVTLTTLDSVFSILALPRRGLRGHRHARSPCFFSGGGERGDSISSEQGNHGSVTLSLAQSPPHCPST